MVRETSQWEREEMEKVVSETKKNLCCFGKARGKTVSVRSADRWPYSERREFNFCSIVAQKNAEHESGWSFRGRSSGWCVIG